MEATVFPNRPAFPIQPAPSPSNQRLKFNPITLPLPPQPPSPPSFPLDPLLQHLLHLSLPPSTTTTPRKPKLIKSAQINYTHLTPPHKSTQSVKLQQTHNSVSSPRPKYYRKRAVQSGDGPLDFLPANCKFIHGAILEQPVSNSGVFFDSIKFELLEVDLVSLLKGLDVSGNWEKALSLFEWIVLNLDSKNGKLDNQLIELIIRILGRESQHSITSKLFDELPIEEYSLDVRACTTILHAYSRTGKYKRAIALFEQMKAKGLSPNLVTYNVMLDAYGKMGRSWDTILHLLDEMRREGLEFDEFTCSTVISACGREGLLDEAEAFFAGLKAQDYVPGTVTYNSLLQVFVWEGGSVL
ncbi:hypothetical protein RJ639_047247 [Escallonia herrerae]|uniref:Pentatricopeptide repeat-containing protein n=1 Tax=Escallonia herrerae TaxID=1293975 RepID=A0AA88W3V1_9ASTE|nr:hypothetical protein RJ639_047247 [Escallonia herrerae]